MVLLNAVAVASKAYTEATDYRSARLALHHLWFALTDAQKALDTAEAEDRLNTWLNTKENAA